MTLSIAVLGATGVYGRHLIPRLVARGYRVRALVRRPETAAIAAAWGAELHRADVFDGASLRSGLDGCDIGINLATSLPGPSGKGDYGTNDRLRREGTPIWVRACHDVGVSRIVQQSIAMVNAGGGDAWADEDTVFPAGQEGTAALAIAAALAMEDTVRQSGLDWTILKRLFSTSQETHRRLLGAFMQATYAGDVGALVAMLAQDAVLITDGGREGRSVGGLRNLRAPLHGAARIAAFVVEATRRVSADLEVEEHELNGQPAMVLYREGAPFAAILLGVADGRIHRVFFHADVARLRCLGRRH
jgi:hypothetical protein